MLQCSVKVRQFLNEIFIDVKHIIELIIEQFQDNNIYRAGKKGKEKEDVI